MSEAGLPHPPSRATKILYIEDNPENRMLARAVLEADGYTVVDAPDGLSGIETAMREKPALILLDVHLPGIDGYEVAGILKSFPDLANTPVVALTAYAMEGDRQRTLVAGCDGYIAKPIDVDAFPSQVAEFLRGKRERLEKSEEGPYLRELNQRLVYRLMNQVEELKRLSGHFARRASQLESLHRAMQGVTSALGVTSLLERLLPTLAAALGSRRLVAELVDPPGVKVTANGGPAAGSLPGPGSSGLPTPDRERIDDPTEVDWTLPLVVQDRHLGTLSARHAVPPGARAEEEQLLKIVANQVAIAVENARLYEETRQRLATTETLLAVSQAVATTLDPAETMRRVAREIALALNADMVSSGLVDEAGRELLPIAGYHVPRPLKRSYGAGPFIIPEHPFVAEALRTGEVRFTSDPENDARLDKDILERFPYRSVMFVPMLANGEPIGGHFVVWWRERHAFTPEQQRLVKVISHQAALAMENARLYEGVQRQMAQLRQTQAQLVQSAKLAAVGELAANVAHEINNPLTSVLGFASYLAERLPPADSMREELKLIQEEAARARDIVRDLLDFSRQREFSPEPHDIGAVLQQTIAMLKRQGGLDRVSVLESYAPDLPLVEVDAARMKQVFLNLINNAVYAMSNAGELAVATTAAEGMVAVEFTDTGAGIAPEHFDKIFDPFFTTKPAVTGTGLGLSVSLGIVQSHGGTIQVKSTVGQGSTFTVKLPVLKAGPTDSSFGPST